MFNAKTWLVGEHDACEYLKKQGYEILEKNCKIGHSELDVVCKLPQIVQKNKIRNAIKDLKSIKKTMNNSEFVLKKNMLKNELKKVEDVLVVVEVKSRSSKKFGEPYEAVTSEKIHNIVRGTNAYLAKNHLENMPVRFDVISIVDGDIEHIEGAFES